jgi:hypothetical protein
MLYFKTLFKSEILNTFQTLNTLIKYKIHFYIPLKLTIFDPCKMKKKFFSILLLLLTFVAQAQVGIGTTAPNPNAVLDLTSTNKGFLMPRLALISTIDPTPLNVFVEGMIVYNTATTGDVVPGAYFSNGTSWVSITEASKEPWFNQATNRAATGNTENIYHMGKVGIGTTSPVCELDVTGTGAIKVPVGTTAQQPSVATAGMIRFNTTTDKFEAYNGTTWVALN